MKLHRGYTILSLMIAMAIGIFITGVAGKVYIDSKMAFLMRSAVAAANENGRFAIEDLRRSLVMAGRGVGAGDDDLTAYTATTDNGLRTFPMVGAAGIVDSDAISGSSVLAVRYATGPSCGGVIAASSTVRFLVNADSELECEVNGVSQPIVSGIVQMRALYGVDTDTDGLANRYLTATEVEAGDFWPNVVSIRVGLIASSGEFELPLSHRPSAAETFDLLGMDVTAPDTSHFFKSVTTTFSLRNLNTVVERQ
ncbi:MAG: hypothetical protein GY814_08750 [Gammaproteobacteria bacterium]|nr:hypothetical protein [Gammaproteobacteria bacterium]